MDRFLSIMKISKFDSSIFLGMVVFISSFCLMVIELVAGRIMAPYLGVHLFSWTSIIGVVLAGISLGNYLGGRLADRYKNKNVLGTIFLLAALFSLTIIIFSNYIGDLLTTAVLPMPIATLVFSLSVFFIPSVLLSYVTPIVIKMSLQDLDKTGRTVGRIYAFSALGSIVGTFATGYFLIFFLGVKVIIFLVSSILFLLGISFVGFNFVKKKISGAQLILFLAVFFASTAVPSMCIVQSNYYCINIENSSPNNSSFFNLELDGLVHSFIDLENSSNLSYNYVKTMAALAEFKSQGTAGNMSMLFLGGGGYTLPRYLEDRYAGIDIGVIEIDPAVIELNYRRLNLSRDTSIKTHNTDVRIFFNQKRIEKKYDFILGDVFNGFAVPYHLTTKEFNQQLKNSLKQDGFYAVNIIDDPVTGDFLTSYIHTLSQTFNHVYVAPWTPDWLDVPKRRTIVVIASDTPLDIPRWENAVITLANDVYPSAVSDRIVFLVSGDALKNLLDTKKNIVLTDDYAPVDYLLGPLIYDM